jgi:hypothetical protein
VALLKGKTMAKRFIDSEIWKKQWFCDLSPALKSFWIYIFSNCDNAGVWETNIPLAEYQIGAKITEDQILSEFQGNIIKLSSGKLFIVDFISFQYGELKEDSVPHRNVFRLLQKHNIGYPIDTLSIEYQGVSNTPKDKDKDKDKDKEDDKEEEEEKEKELTWRESLEVYQKQSSDAWDALMANPEWIKERKRYHPSLDIRLSMEKAYNDFWGTEAGWKHKKAKKSKEIDWDATFKNALSLKANQVYVQKIN